ncbi:MAG: ATP-dependent DNA helicase UvrD2 [Actinomycetota bacterium]|nr:ATP-dependent DNA helicase UvrD2 [Actinomycetota bacterium]
MALPGPPALGRSVIIVAGSPIPAAWAGAAVVTIDEVTLHDPAGTVQRLHEAWGRREPMVIELTVDPARFRDPTSVVVEPWSVEPAYEPWFDRLHHLVWANSYDARSGAPIWWWARKAVRLGAVEDPTGDADVLLPDGSAAWVDGGPRRPFAPEEVGGSAVVHTDSVADGALAVVPLPIAPTADLAADQLAAVAHGAGPARVIAPAGSGKTRVLTERLRHLRREWGYAREDVLAVAYNKQAQLELEGRARDVNPRVRTLNSLGLATLTAHRGAAPRLLEERDVRRIVEKVAPIGRRRRANTDPVGPYVEAISLVRLGLRDPAEVEASRDDVPGLPDVYTQYRRHLSEQGAIDFDEQIYAAIEALLADGPFRRRMQATCRHLLIDEFQDLTPAHVLLLRLLSLPALDVFGVGDDDQVIYQHAGADPAFLIDFADLFPGAATHPLTFNYRCPVEVVSAADTLLGYNHWRVPKRIEAGPGAEAMTGAFRVIEHEPDAGARALGDVVTGWLANDAVTAGSVAVLARVNSLLLAPHVALHEAGVPLRSELRPTVLDRTGLRAALAYLRLAGAPEQFDGDDIVEILRRPTRGLPPWFSERLGRRATWTTPALRRIAATVPDKDADKVERLVDDIELVVEAADGGSTREVLLAVRDTVGLGQAMGMLDRTGSGQGSSHLDDLEALLQVADLHPDPATFESWLRQVFQREVADDGVTLSTVHRVKGREWDRVAVFGASSGILPHRLTEDLEEERRVLHVAITRGRQRVVVLADRSRRSPFLDELSGVAPKPSKPSKPVVRSAGSVGTGGRRVAPAEPPVLSGTAARIEADLRTWRTGRARADRVPAYVVLTDRSLQGIATAGPTTLAELLACDGIGPAKLENYGEEILALVAGSTDPPSIDVATA